MHLRSTQLLLAKANASTDLLKSQIHITRVIGLLLFFSNH